jgi:transposase InsO family protein
VGDREGRRGGRSERPDVLEVGRALPRRGCGRAGRSLLGAQKGGQPHRRADRARHRRVAAPAVHRPGDLRAAGPSAVDRFGGAQADRDGKLGRLGLEPAQRYERARPGELIHIDVKKLGRIQGGAGKRIWGGSTHYNPRPIDEAGKRRKSVGWDTVHIAIDDATRLAYAEVLHDEKAVTAIGFLHRAIAFFKRHGITVQRVITDNGAPYVSTVHAIACRTHGIRHLRTRPYRPQTNGKAERFIRTMLAGWAYSGAIYGSSRERTAALDGWLYHYNHHRPHQAIGRQTPITRLNNLLGTYS